MRTELIKLSYNKEGQRIYKYCQDYCGEVVNDSLLLFSFSEDELLEENLREMVAVMEHSQYHVFVVPGDTNKKDDYSITYDITDAEYVLMNPYIPKLVSDLDIGNMKAIDDIQELAERIITCGYSCVEANRLIVNKYDDNSLNRKASNGKILYYAQHIQPYKNGGTIHILGLLEGIVKVLSNNYVIDVCITRENAEHYSIENEYGVKTFSQDEISDIYELCIVPYQIFLPEAFEFVIRHSRKWINWILDAIDLRGYRGLQQRKYAVPIFETMDGLAFFSNDVYDDILSLMPNSLQIDDIPRVITYIPARKAVVIDELFKAKNKLPFDSFILVFGNGFPHKLIATTINHIINTDENYIVVGCEEEGFVAPNIYGYVSGSLSEELINLIYDSCEMLLFPSIYEGFGLPVVDALNYGKEVVIVDRPLNHELESLCPGFRGHLHYYRNYDELPQVFFEARNEEPLLHKNLYDRTWIDVAKDLQPLITEIFNKPKDDKREELIGLCFSLNDGGTQKYKTLLNIVRTDYSDIDCPFVIDIYGKAGSGKIFYNMVKDYCDIGCFVDVAAKNNSDDDNIEIVRPIDYVYDDSHILVVIPEWDFQHIKSRFVKRDNRFKKNVIRVTTFIEKNR